MKMESKIRPVRTCGPKRMEPLRSFLEANYQHYHHPSFIQTDPLGFVWRYSNPLDQEIVGLLAASLAYGRVASIHASLERALACLQPSPRRFLETASPVMIRKAVRGFQHRWTRDHDLARLLTGAARVMRDYGSLGKAFAALDDPSKPITDGLERWVAAIQPEEPPGEGRALLALPARKSACKRLHLYLRWMVRKDAIDPGCWHAWIDPSRLWMPVDTHVHRFARSVGLTARPAADGRAAEEISQAFRYFDPADPVRFDFSLTRPGILLGLRPDSIGEKINFTLDEA